LLENLLRNSVEHGSTGSRPEADDAVEHSSTSTRSEGREDAGRGDGVTVTVGSLDDRTGFYVADDGSGIPQEARESAFEPGVTTTDDGSGFGLAIVARIAAAHGWAVTLTESDAGGARFEFAGVDLSDDATGDAERVDSTP
jgi:signal transduction histidine kinase